MLSENKFSSLMSLPFVNLDDHHPSQQEDTAKLFKICVRALPLYRVLLKYMNGCLIGMP